MTKQDIDTPEKWLCYAHSQPTNKLELYTAKKTGRKTVQSAAMLALFRIDRMAKFGEIEREVGFTISQSTLMALMDQYLAVRDETKRPHGYTLTEKGRNEARRVNAAILGLIEKVTTQRTP